jgi:ferredoxin-NADP reductase
MTATEAAAARPGRLRWLTAEVIDVVTETPRVKSLVLRVPGWPGHRPGQHLDVRLTGEDGYQAQRQYSIASDPEATHLALAVERIEDGEVSPYLVDAVVAGDRFELRGPIGGYFVWTASLGGPLFLIAGGSGIAPLMAMLRHCAAAGSAVPARLLYSSRTFDDIIFRAELEQMAAPGGGVAVTHTLTRGSPPGWRGEARRIDRDMLIRAGFPPNEHPRVFVCGPTSLVEAVAQSLLDIGHAPGLIKTERFGPTGP